MFWLNQATFSKRETGFLGKWLRFFTSRRTSFGVTKTLVPSCLLWVGFGVRAFLQSSNHKVKELRKTEGHRASEMAGFGFPENSCAFDLSRDSWHLSRMSLRQASSPVLRALSQCILTATLRRALLRCCFVNRGMEGEVTCPGSVTGHHSARFNSGRSIWAALWAAMPQPRASCPAAGPSVPWRWTWQAGIYSKKIFHRHQLLSSPHPLLAVLCFQFYFANKESPSKPRHLITSLFPGQMLGDGTVQAASAGRCLRASFPGPSVGVVQGGLGVAGMEPPNPRLRQQENRAGGVQWLCASAFSQESDSNPTVNESYLNFKG